MKEVIRQGLLKFLAATSMAIATGAPSPAALAEIPIDVVDDVVEDSESWDIDDREQLLRVLAHDHRAAVRGVVSQELADLLHESTSFERIDVIDRWAGSEHAEERVALAHALSRQPLPSIVTDLAIRILAHDTNAHVRRAAVSAAATQLTLAPTVYDSVLRGLANDRERRVRHLARRILQLDDE